MTGNAAVDHPRRDFGPAVRLVCGLLAAIGLMGAVPAAASAQTTDPNPELPVHCGEKVALVLDESASIASPGGNLGDQTSRVRAAADAFITALKDTGSSVALTAFSLYARDGVVPYTEVNDSTIGTFRNWIDHDFNPAAPNRAGTNWEDGLLHADEVAGGPPDLMVFVTDGDPNRVGRGTSSTTATTANAVNAAVTASNLVKSRPTHIFAVGVGTAVGTPAHAENIRRISGTREFTPGTNFADSDYTLVESFDDLQKALTGVVASLCGSSLVITKWVSHPDEEDFTTAEGWQFTSTLDPSPGHTWLEPASAGTAHSATTTTNAAGHATFQWRLSTDTTAILGVTHERLQEGLHFVEARCETVHADGSMTLSESTTQIPGATLGRREFRTCDVYNAGPGAHLTVVKHLVPHRDPGRFDLLVGGIARIERVGHNGSTGRLLLGFGTHTVSERVTAAQADVITLSQYSITTHCVNQAGHSVGSSTGGRPVSVRLEHETDDVTCTITNRRTAPVPPGVVSPGPPIIPPPECDPSDPDCANAADARPRLMVTKRMPARAHVGERVPIKITVRNIGEQTAHSVRVHETRRGAGGRIVHVAGAHATRRRDGSITWSIGNLAPGASRTVRATMLVTRRGLVRDTAVADAANAQDAFDPAALRAIRVPPPVVTG